MEKKFRPLKPELRHFFSLRADKPAHTYIFDDIEVPNEW